MISKIYERKLKNQLFKLSIITMITVIIWIGMITYQSLTKSKIKQTIKLKIKPLTSELDLDTIKDIKNRQEIVKTNWSSLTPQLPSDFLLPNIQATKSGEVDTKKIVNL